MTDKRTPAFKRNSLLETLLYQLNDDLQPAEQKLLARYREQPMQYPLILVMGPLRSGTTLFTQWLANTGLISYPTNLLSRFYQAPILGAKIQLLLTDLRFNFRNELGEFVQEPSYWSENGKTQGVLAPNEFWYFWRRFLTEPSRDVWMDEELRQTMDVAAMKAELVGVMDVMQKPFAAKGMLFNYNIPFLDSIFEKILFVQLKRDPIANVASILEARKRQLGSEDAWYSFKIPEYEDLVQLDPIRQCAGQVHYTNRAVDNGLEYVDDSRKMVVLYEDFCDDPRNVFDEMMLKIGFSGEKYSGVNRFNASRLYNILNRAVIEDAFGVYN